MSVPQLEDWAARYRRDAWLPRLEPAAAGAVTDGVPSMFGGRPWLAPGELWPACQSCQEPLQFLFQLNLSDLPLGFQPQPASGVLQLFLCAAAGEGGCRPRRDPCQPCSEATLVRIVELADGETAAATPVDAAGDSLELPCQAIVGWQRVDEWPRYDEWDGLGLREIQRTPAFTAYSVDGGPVFRLPKQELTTWKDTHPCHAGDKLGGWPYWLQDVEYPNCRQCFGGRQMERLWSQFDGYGALNGTLMTPAMSWILQCPKHQDAVAYFWQA